MKAPFQIKNLLKTSLYASPSIGILAITPIFIIKEFPFSFFPKAVLVITLATLVIWWLNILLIKVSDGILILKLYKKLRFVFSYVFSILILMLLLNIFRFCIPGLNNIAIVLPTHSNYASIAMGFSINTIILIILDLILLREKKTKIEFENAQLLVKNMEAANQQLKQQIHPHFLFNSLNTLKSLIKKSPEEAGTFLIKLSDFLRTSISESDENIVQIVSELKLCKDYLEMQKIRYGNALQYQIDIPDAISSKGFIPFFALQLLIENAIKHNTLTKEKPLAIKINSDNNQITVTNNLQLKITTEKSTGIGLTNLSERYKIISGDEVLIDSTDNFFSVTIKIIKNENSNHRG